MYNDFNLEETFGSNMIVVSKIVIESYINENGIIESYEKKSFNILNDNNKKLMSDRWFDVYVIDRTNNYENCIVGFENSLREISDKSKYEKYLDIDGNLLSFYKYSYGVINAFGKFIIPPVLDRISKNSVCYTGCYNEKFGYISCIDGALLTPLVFDGASDFSCGLAHVEYKGKSGYIRQNFIIVNPDNKEEYAIYPQYDWGSDFENGIAKVRKDNYMFLIDTVNNIIERQDIKKYYK